jgi:hypothetical protein
MLKTFIIGDVHGCIKELKELMQILTPGADDHLIFIGDLIDRGPDSIGVVRQVFQWSKQMNVKLILGNHEEKFLRYVHYIKDGSGKEKQMKRIDEFPQLLDALGDDELSFLQKAFHSIHLTDYNSLLIHGGLWRDIHFLLPATYMYQENNSDINKQLSLLNKTRYLNPEGKFVSYGDEKPEDNFWAQEYKGQFGHIYFGHHSFIQSNPYQFSHATAIDTGCVYGGWLTAVELSDNKVQFKSVAARKVYSKRLEMK